MRDARKPSGSSLRDDIDIDDADEVEYWTGELGVPPEHLREAVEAVGPAVAAVRRHLAGMP